MGKDSLPRGARLDRHDERGVGEPMSAERQRAIRLDVQRASGMPSPEEAMRLLPRKFVEAYMLLHEVGLRSLGSSLGNVSDAPKQQIRDTFVVSNGGLKDETAIAYRKSVNRQLRLIGRDMVSWLEGTRDQRRALTAVCSIRCYQCNKFIEGTWNNCAWCGRAIEKVEEN